jgi:N-acetyl-alpha-D-muramate 1-phosphate uridylyltransferase
MRAMILSAGRGKRMQELTNNMPKPLLKVHNKCLIEYNIEALVKIGIKHIVINIYYLGGQIQKFLGDGSKFGATIDYSEEKQLLDTGGGIVKSLPYLGPEPFLVLSADIYTDFNYQIILDKAKSFTNLAHVIMVNNPEYHVQGDFGLENGLLVPNADNKFTYGNIGLFAPEFFAGAPLGAFPLSLLLKKAIDLQQVTAEHYTGMWHNIGRAKDLAAINQCKEQQL